MKRINFFSFVLISLLLALVPFESVSANEERSLDPEDLERSLYSFQSYQGDKWYFDAIDTPNSNNNGANVTIAILDTGVTKTSQLACHNFVSEYDAFWDISGPGSARDIGSHGTLVAHTIADCDIGIAKSVNIMPVRIFTDAYASYGYPSYTDDLAVAMGIVWAVDNGADIINMSFGASCFSTWDGGCKGDTGYYAGYVDGAIKYAYDNGVLLIAASGNNALPWVSYPANNPYVWAVGAVNQNLNKSDFSNFGSALDFVAPGENIGTALDTVQGTSFSSPEVAAAAAVLKGSMPGLSVEEIEGAFICTVVDLGDAGWDPEYGWGMIQIEASLDLLNAGLLQTPWFPTPTLTLVSEGQGKIKAMWQPADDCNDIDSYSLYKNGEFINSYNKNNTEGYVTVTESGTYSLSVRATNVFSNNTELITASIDIDLTPPQWDEGASISIAQQNDTLVYSWPSAQDESGISNYALRVERDGELVIQENTISTSLSFSLGYFEDPGTYSVSLKVFDEFNNENALSAGFIIEDTTSTTTTSTTTTSTTTTTVPDSNEDEDEDNPATTTTTSTSTTTTLPSFNSVTTTTTIPVFDTTTTTTVPITVTASTSSELVGCISNSQIGESAVRLWITNTTSVDAYFDVRYSTNSGSTWTNLRDGEFISSSAAYMFLTPNLPNNTSVQWQWRGGINNPSSGNYSYGTSITVSGCPTVDPDSEEDNSSSTSTTTTSTSTTTTIDTTPPNISNFSASPGSITATENNNINISVSVIDDQNTVSSVSVTLKNGSGNTVKSCIAVKNTSNSYNCTISIESGFTAGTYYWSVEASDTAGNINSSNNISQLSVDAGDSTPPVVTNVTLSTTSVDVSTSSKVVTVTGTVSDSQSNLSLVAFGLMDDNNSNGSTSYCQFNPNAGSGTYSCDITIPTTQVSVSFRGWVAAHDIAGNVSDRTYTSYYLTVTNTSGDDSPPVVTNVTLSTTSVDVSTSSKVVTVTGTVTDANNLSLVAFGLMDDNNSNGSTSYCQFNPNAGSGTYSCDITIPTTQVSVSFRGWVAAHDIAGNVSDRTYTSYYLTVTNNPTISANTSSELVGCLTGDDAGKSKVRLWVTNTSGIDAYFDVQYSTNNGSSWSTLGDGEFISNGAAYMFITSQYSNGTNVIWQWRGSAAGNPNSGGFTSGASITISGC